MIRRCSLTIAAAILSPGLLVASVGAAPAQTPDAKGKVCRMEQQCHWENFKKICTWVKVCH
jgi:hypothetical protein